jgi:hypothetical protein
LPIEEKALQLPGGVLIRSGPDLSPGPYIPPLNLRICAWCCPPVSACPVCKDLCSPWPGPHAGAGSFRRFLLLTFNTHSREQYILLDRREIKRLPHSGQILSSWTAWEALLPLAAFILQSSQQYLRCEFFVINPFPQFLQILYILGFISFRPIPRALLTVIETDFDSRKNLCRRRG